MGQIAAVDLSKQGAHIVIIARSAAKADATRALVAAETPFDIFLADLTSMAEVRRVGTEIAAKYPRIDVLINNVGIHGFTQRVTVDGYPEMVAVNYFAPWLLTRALRDSLVRAGPARIVNVASEASHRHGVFTLPSDLTDTTPFSTTGSGLIYGKTKLLNIMFNSHLARELAGTQVTANAMCPGFNVTGLGHELWFAGALSSVLKLLGVGDPRRGAGIIVRMAVGDAVAGKTGGYYTVGKSGGFVGFGKEGPVTPVHPAGDVAMEKLLWECTEELLGA